jgi:hypothetical protein
MNSLAISPEIVLYMLQGQNIKRDTVNKVDMTGGKVDITDKKEENSNEKDKKKISI